MIYKGTEYTLERDLREDLNQWAYNVLTTAHFENVNLDRALYQYCNMQLRLLEPKPRKVLVSKELVIPDNAKAGYEYFKTVVEKGDHLLPFMSRSIVDVAFKDKMIFDWGLFHFHLSTKVYDKDPRFMERSEYLLIAYVDQVHDDTMYFLQIRPHISSVWTEQELVRILVNNWPDTMETRRIKGFVSLTENVTDEDYKQLRKANVNTMVDLHDGRVYMGANLGLNTAGTSVRAICQYDMYCNQARLFQESIGRTADAIGDTINKKLYEPEKSFTLKMVTPGDRDYLFKVENHGFYLRVITKGDNMQIVVGDTAEQIEEALS